MANLNTRDPQNIPPDESQNQDTSFSGEKGITRRDFIRLAGAAFAAKILGIPATAHANPDGGNTPAPPADATDSKAEKGIDVSAALEQFDQEVANLYPSDANKGTMLGLMGWFSVAAARGFMPAGWQKTSALNNDLLHKLAVFSPTSGAGMFGAEALGRLPLLHHSSNSYDRKNHHHEHEEVYGNIYLVFLMSYLAHFAETGIRVSPQADATIQNTQDKWISELQKKHPKIGAAAEKLFSIIGFNKISGGWKLDETKDRPADDDSQKEWEQHFQNAEADMLKATTDILTYSAATAFTIAPTVYGTSAFSAGVERKYMVSTYEYFIAKAHLDGKTGEEAVAQAMKDANEAYDQFFSFKLAFVDNILAGFGVDGPCIPLFIKLYEANGINGIINYYKVMIPNIAKYTAAGMEMLLGATMGVTAAVKNQPRFAALAVGETLVNGATVNAFLIFELLRKLFVDKQLDKSAAFVHELLARPQNGGDETVQEIERHMKAQSDLVFSFDFNIADFTQELASWFSEIKDSIFHPTKTMDEAGHSSKKFQQENALSQHLHAVILERYQVLAQWGTKDIDKQREIIEDLLNDDPILKEQYGETPVDELMQSTAFRKFIADHLSNVVRTNSDLFSSLLTDEHGHQLYPDIEKDDFPYIVQKSIGQFVKSLRLKINHVDSHVHAEAAKEVEGALSGQLVGAAVASSIAHWLLMQNVELDASAKNDLDAGLNNALAGSPDLLIHFVDKLTLQQNEKRGTLSPITIQDLETEKNSLVKAIVDLETNKNNNEKIREMLKQLAVVVAKIFQAPRQEELSGNLKKIYGTAAGMTPIADNIAAVLFAVAAGKQTVGELFGEEGLKRQINIPVVPGLPLTAEMSADEALIILAGMIGINLGNGTLWGNGVQLGEKTRRIVKVNSSNIGDLEIKRESALKTPGKYTMFTNRYAFVPDMWTIADVNAQLNHVTEQLTRGTTELPGGLN